MDYHFPLGATPIIVLYTYTTREMQKGLFFEAKRDSCKSGLGVKMSLFFRKGSFWILLRGVWRSFSQTPPNMSTMFRGKFGGKIAQNSHSEGVFPEEGEMAIRVRFENLQ